MIKDDEVYDEGKTRKGKVKPAEPPAVGGKEQGKHGKNSRAANSWWKGSRKTFWRERKRKTEIGRKKERKEAVAKAADEEEAICSCSG